MMIDSNVATTSFLLCHHVALLQSYFPDTLLQMEMHQSLLCYTSTSLFQVLVFCLFFLVRYFISSFCAPSWVFLVFFFVIVAWSKRIRNRIIFHYMLTRKETCIVLSSATIFGNFFLI